ncbi:hypothetical protein [Streptomyces sp. NPDC055287]
MRTAPLPPRTVRRRIRRLAALRRLVDDLAPTRQIAVPLTAATLPAIPGWCFNR